MTVSTATVVRGKGDCVSRESLTHSHPVTGFSSGILQDLLEVIVRIESNRCMKETNITL